MLIRSLPVCLLLFSMALPQTTDDPAVLYTRRIIAQEKAPQLLLHAAQCLEVKGFLPSPGAAGLTFGYFLDEKSYPDGRVIYIVEYSVLSRSKNSVLTVFLTDDNGSQGFNIQNNATFVLSKEESSGVLFLNPPLGGTWTQQHLAAAIKEIEKQPRFAISAEELVDNDMTIQCESYTDPQPKKHMK